MKTQKIVAVVVTYNRKTILEECIRSLINQSLNDIDVLIIDNASTDGTKEYIASYLGNSKVYYFNTNANLGGAAGFNIGIRKAYEMGYKYIWIMDDDSIPRLNCAEVLANAANTLDGDFGFLSSYVEWSDGSPCVMNIQSVSPKWINSSEKLKKGMLRVENASFVSMFINREAVEKCGLPIKEFYIWGDDAEYSERISKFYKNYFVSDSIVTHKTDSNHGIDICQEKIDKIDRMVYMYRNRMYLSRKKGIIRTLRSIGHNVVEALKVMKKSSNKIKRVFVIVKGTTMGLIFNPQIEMLSDISGKDGL